MANRGGSDRRRRDDYDDYSQNSQPRSHRRQADYEGDRGPGLAGDYYDGHPSNPNHHRRRSHDPPPKLSKTNRAITALEDGDFKSAFQAFIPQSRSAHPSTHQPRPHHEHHSHPQPSSRRRDYSSDRGYDRDRDDRRGRGRASSQPRSSSRRHSTERENKWQQVAGAALTAGAVEAFRMRKQPGGWNSGKAVRVATAAFSAAAIDRGVDRNPDKHKKRNVAEATIGGLVLNQFLNGSKPKSNRS